MRFIFFLLALGTATAASATENARTAYVERRGLLEADAQCRLFEPSIRAALSVGLAQTRGALLREGWTNARLRELDSAAVNAATSAPKPPPKPRAALSPVGPTPARCCFRAGIVPGAHVASSINPAGA
jgi:hypothetical protein